MNGSIESEGEWRELFSSIVRHTVEEGESVEEVVETGWLLGQRRARLWRRDFHVYEDVPIGLTFFCWWLFKPDIYDGSRQYLLNNRRRILVEARRNRGPDFFLSDIVPDNVLELSWPEVLDRMQREPIQEIINL
jgi:hypothetical protein